MKKLTTLLVVFLMSFTMYSQKNLRELLNKLNKNDIAYINVTELQEIIADDDIILLDAREKKEYNVSHLKNAQLVGYTNFNLKKTLKKLPNKDAKIVVYCSLGVRSEDIAEKLEEAGYTNVLNLYGGIFEWKNKDCKVYDIKNKETQKVHAYDTDWGKWLKKGDKVYD